MCQMVDRFKQNNLHVIISDKKALIYDVPTNTIYNVSVDMAKKVKELQNSSDKEYKSLENIMLNKLQGKEITVPKHSYWGECKTLSKLTINVTTKCNLRCKYCFADFGTYSGYKIEDMKPEDAKRYIDNFIIKNGINQINMVQFFGGEPLLMISTVEAICEYFLKLYHSDKIRTIPVFSMITNLVAYNEKIFSVISKYNIRLTISVDGPSEIHDLQRIFPNGTGSAERVFKNAKILKKYIVGIEATYTFNHVRAGLTLSDLRKYLSNTFDVEHGKVLVVPVIGNTELEVDRRKYATFLKNDSLGSEDIQALIACDSKMQNDLFCTTGYQSACIMPEGDLYPCHMYAKDKHFCLGNLKKACSAEDIKEKLEELLSSNKKENYMCVECWARKICHFCPGNYLKSENSEMVGDNICKRRKSQYEKILIKSIK